MLAGVWLVTLNDLERRNGPYFAGISGLRKHEVLIVLKSVTENVIADFSGLLHEYQQVQSMKICSQNDMPYSHESPRRICAC